MWLNIVEETGEHGEDHRPWIGYPAICLDPDLSLDPRGDNRVCYPLCYPGSSFDFIESYFYSPCTGILVSFFTDRLSPE